MIRKIMAPAPQRRLPVDAADAVTRNRFLESVPNSFGARLSEPFVVDWVGTERGGVELDLSGVVSSPFEDTEVAVAGLFPSGVMRMMAGTISGMTLRVRNPLSLIDGPDAAPAAIFALFARPDFSDHAVQMAKAEDIMARYRDTLHILAQ